MTVNQAIYELSKMKCDFEVALEDVKADYATHVKHDPLGKPAADLKNEIGRLQCMITVVNAALKIVCQIKPPAPNS